MTGVCGWIGSPVEDAAGALERMAQQLSRFDRAPLTKLVRGAAAVAVSGNDQTACVIDEGGVQLALSGHPRWEDGQVRITSPAAAARAFLVGYRASGADALRCLTGDFALALVDAARSEALVAIDRIGVRNLLYTEVKGGLVFGSTADALHSHPHTNRNIDPQAIYNYAYFHMVPGPRTAFAETRRVLPGQYLLFSRGRTTIGQYWQMVFDEDEKAEITQLKPRFLAALRDGIGTAATGSDSTCGSFLSGGTDSSTVAGLLGGYTGGRARTYSIGFDAEGFDEMSYARLASRHFGTEHHEYYVTPSDVVEAIPAIADVYDVPFGNASAIPTYFCAKLAREDGITRLLGGDGGDELFGGNARYAKQYQFSLYDQLPYFLRSAVIEPMLHNLPGASRVPLLRKAQSYVQQASLPMPARYETYNLLERLGAANVFTPEFLASVDPSLPLAQMGEIYGAARAQSLINPMLALDLKITLADNDLPKVTRMCELAGVDVAFPLLHESVVDFSAGLAPVMKLKGTTLRYFFKEALRDFLPNEIIAKEKHGFGLPVGTWLQNHPPLRELALDSLQSLKRRNIVRAEFIDSLLSDHLQSHAGYYGTMVWILMMLELWFERHA